MKGLSQKAVKAAEDLVIALLKDAVKKYKSRRIPVNDPDWAEAHGVLRGLLCSRGKSTSFQPIRTSQGNGPPDYSSVNDWLHHLLNKIEIE